MPCNLYGTIPLPEPMLTYCQMDPYEQTSVKFKREKQEISSEKFILK